MKLKSIIPAFAALTGLLLMPSLSKASTTTPNQAAVEWTIGDFSSNGIYGRVYFANDNGQFLPYAFNAVGGSFTLSLVQGASLNCGAYADGCKTAAVKAFVFFTDATHQNTPAIATLNTACTANGKSSFDLTVVSYANPSIVLFTTGKSNSNEALAMPVTQGSITIGMNAPLPAAN